MEIPRWYASILDKEFKQLRLVVVSDAHVGNPLFSEKHFKRTLDFIADNADVFCILNGDLVEAITKTSKGILFDQKITPQEQRDYVIELLKPIKEKILGATWGNHERRIYNEVGLDVMQDIVKALATKKYPLGLPYRAEGMIHKIKFGHGNEGHPDKSYVFWGYCTHGYGGARTKSGKAVKVERTATWVNCDFYAMSHDHVVNVAPDDYLDHDDRETIDKETNFVTGKVVSHRKMLIKTNAYLKWGGYSEMGGFPPVDLATPVIFLLTPESDYWNLVPERPQKAVKVIV